MIEAVIFDWAGTTVDFGCMAPIDAFYKAFEKEGIKLIEEDIRKPMGMKKWDHIKMLLDDEKIKNEWERVHGVLPTEKDIDRIHKSFEEVLFKNLKNHSKIKPGVKELSKELKELGIKIGSTTGYTNKMVKVVETEAEEQGYRPDFVATSEITNGFGRPSPYMIFKNMENLLIDDVRKVMKVGDTVSDIQEGKNAGVITVGVIEGSSLAGLSYDEFISLNKDELYNLNTKTREKYLESGADFVLEKIADLTGLIEKLNSI